MARRLAAIVAADVVGYSRMMHADEGGTFAALNALRTSVIDPKVAQYDGRTIKLMGDGSLIEFPSVVEAVKFAIDTQLAIAEWNAARPVGASLLLRIGVNVGDVIAQDGDLYGDGVNLASRLEGLAEPGGICVERTVRNQVRDKLDLSFEDMGEMPVKGIARPVRAFRIRLDDAKAAAVATPIAPSSLRRERRFGARHAVLSALVIVTLAVGSAMAWRSGILNPAPSQVGPLAHPLPDQPSVAVLPFDNISNDPQQEYFADGMTEDIITDLSKISGLFVIARNSSFAYKDRPKDITTVAEELGVRYVLEGSVRRSGDDVRINAQLVDALTGGHLWAERYDGALTNVFALQDDVTFKIVSALAVNLTADEKAKASRSETDSQHAYDAFLQGWAHYRENTPRSIVRSIPFFERALTFDPDYANAHAALASIYWIASEERDAIGHPGLWLAALGLPYGEARGMSAAHLAEALKKPSPLAHRVASAKLIRESEFDAAIAEAQAAVTLDPNDPVGYEALAKAHIYAGEPDEGAAALSTAMRLDPLFRVEYLPWLGLTQLLEGNDAAAVRTLEAALRDDPENDLTLVLLTAALGRLGRVEDGKRMQERLDAFRASHQAEVAGETGVRLGIDTLLVGPFTLANIDYWPFKNAADRETIREGLRLAGVPEEADESVSPVLVPGATTVDAVQAKALLDQGVAFVDTRNRALWELGRIPGAKLLDFASDFTKDNLAGLIDRDEPVVIYCEGPKCLRSSKACELAVDWGFSDVFYFREGFPAWRAAGYETETGQAL